MIKYHTPDTIRAPFANYHHAVEIPADARLLICSGQLGITVDEVIPQTAEAQASLCFENIGEILRSADMNFSDIVRINAYVTDRVHLSGYMAARDRFVAEPPPASTLMIVAGFAREEFKVEIEVMAARVDE